MSDISTITNKIQLPKTLAFFNRLSYADYDDGYYFAGSPISNSRFVDNWDGTISDRATNLMWVKDPIKIIPGASVRADNQIQFEGGDYADDTYYSVAVVVADPTAMPNPKFYVCVIAHTSDGANLTADLANNPASWRETVWTGSAANLTTHALFVWSDSEGTPSAIGSCEALDYAGYTDWRLPNQMELISLNDWGTKNPSIYSNFFPVTNNPTVWSSTTVYGSTGSAWFVCFYDSYINYISKSNSTYCTAYPVRSI